MKVTSQLEAVTVYASGAVCTRRAMIDAPAQPTRQLRISGLPLSLRPTPLRARVVLPGGSTVLAVVTHLHHLGPGEAIRDEQTALILDWLAEAPEATATLLMGDFNADPAEPSPVRLRDAGFRSAYEEANGAEPAVTWPSGLISPAMDTDGDPECLDYIWLRGTVHPTSARLVFDRPDPDDPTLYPSDHLGIAALLEVG